MRTLLFFILSALYALATSGQVTAGFNVDVAAGCAPHVVNFTNTSTGATSYSWNLGNGTITPLVNPSTSYLSVGTYTVVLTATNGSATSTYTRVITVHPSPTVIFSASDTTVCPGAPIAFSNSSISGVPGPMTNLWNFGDGTTATSAMPTHAYAASGYYNVTLFATNSYGCVASLIKSAYIHVYTPPFVNFTGSPVVICNPPGSVTFTNFTTGTGPFTYNWRFGDGGTSTATSPSHGYTAPGTYTVKLSVTDANGCTDSITRAAYILADTINASFTGPTTACKYATIPFFNTSSPHLTRVWNFGDGSPTSTSFSGIHAYAVAGTYTISLTVSNGPCSHTFTRTIVITDGPGADFTIAPVHPCPAPQTITYTGTGPASTAYSWYFEDGSTATGGTASYTYGTNGIKSVTMIAQDPVTGCRDTVIKADTLFDLFFFANAAPGEGCVPLTVTFGSYAETSVPTGTMLPYPYALSGHVWDFGDGSPTTSGTAPVHTFTAVGIYTVTVTAVTDNGCPVTATVRIEVGAPPVATFTATPRHVCYGSYTPVLFTPTIVTGPIDEYSWVYGDGGGYIDSSGAGISYVYTMPGLFTVTLTPSYRGCPGTPFVMTDYIKVDSSKSIIAHVVSCTIRNQVAFFDSSLGADSHLWIFGDGTTSTVDDPVHTFPGFTVYTVSLTTHNVATGCRDTARRVIDLTPPVPNFIADDTVICRDESIHFIGWVTGGPAVLFEWIVDTNVIPIMFGYPDFFRTFTSTGYHTISLVTRNVDGCFDTTTRTNYILVAKPVANFTGSPVSGCLPLNVTFTNSSTPTVGTSLASYYWTFGDGGTAALSAPLFTTSHTYTAVGTYSVSLNITDNVGCKDTIVRSAYISVFQPVASFVASTLFPCINAPVSFTNTSTGGVVSSVWDFGDGNSSTAMSPVHYYAATGTYSIRLTVTDANGCTSTILLPAHIQVTKPTASFTMSDSVSVCPPLFVNFTNTSIGASGYSWTFGDGNASLVASPSNMYITSGLFNIMMVASNFYGCRDTAYKSVNIFGYAGAFTYSPLQGCSPLAVSFIATLSNIPHITWDFSDGSTSTASFTDTITHIYTTPGAYVPKLLLSDNTGCQTSSIGLDTIKVEQINPKFNTDPSPVCINMAFTFLDSSTAYWSPVSMWQWTYDGITSTLPSPTHTFTAIGTYPVTMEVENAWGCKATITRNIVIAPPPTVTASADTVVCVGDPAVLTGYGAVTYTWAPPATLSCVTCNPTIATPPAETTYTVTGADIYGCIDTATVTVLHRTHTISNAWGDTAVCFGVPVQLYDTGGHTYQWLPPTGLSNPNIATPIASPPYTTIYTVIARLGGCIPDTNTVTVIVYPQPTVNAGPDQRLLAGSTAQLQATGTDIASYSWWPSETLSCPDCPNPVASMTVRTTYNVDVVSEYGCRASDSVTIILYCDNSMVFIPNAFTPNGDGQNDVFYPRGAGIEVVKTFRIYNRWGELIFERQGIELNDAGNAWDGSYNGADPKPDVYVYIMEATCYTGEQVMVKGDVTIIK